MLEVQPLSVIDGKTLLSLDVDPPKFIINRFLPAGLHMLAGSPKIGKSWLALWLCQQVAKGEPVWEFETQQCSTLYISLEDTIDRLHYRLSRITDKSTEQSYFTTNADCLSGTLIAQLEKFMQEYPDTGLIVIDTFQRIRGYTEKAGYSNDYEEIGKIKDFADRYKIAVLLVHHLRKMPDNDPFNMVSGTTGIIGAVDSLYVLEKENRLDNKAKLHVTGRDIEDMQLILELDRSNNVWRFISFMEGEKSENKLIPALIALLADRHEFVGTATELLALLQEYDKHIDLKANTITQRLKEQALTLEKSYGIQVEFSRKNSARLIRIWISDGDGKNSYLVLESEPSLSDSSLKALRYS